MSNFTDIKHLHESGRAMNLSLNTKQSIHFNVVFFKISNKLPCMKYDLLFAVDLGLHVLTHCVRCKVVGLFNC